MHVVEQLICWVLGLKIGATNRHWILALTRTGRSVSIDILLPLQMLHFESALQIISNASESAFITRQSSMAILTLKDWQCMYLTRNYLAPAKFDHHNLPISWKWYGCTLVSSYLVEFRVESYKSSWNFGSYLNGEKFVWRHFVDTLDIALWVCSNDHLHCSWINLHNQA